MINEITQDSESRMNKSIESLKGELSRVRTGRAHPSLLEQITVDYYGSDTPLSQVANVSVSDGRTLMVTPWEKTMVAPVEKAILNSGLGLNPSTAGQAIRIPMPPLTEERRKELIKVVKATVENAKISIRNVRRDANAQFKDLVKEKEISEDDERRAQDIIQKMTDKSTTLVDQVFSEKEADLLEV